MSDILLQLEIEAPIELGAVQNGLAVGPKGDPGEGMPGNPVPTADNDVVVGSILGTWLKKTLAEFKIILGLGSAAYVDIGDVTSADELVKYDAGDTVAGYLADKIIAGTGISLSEGTGADENKLKITGTGSYSLPIATASILGGVKEGSGVTIGVDGTISAAGTYTLPIATGSTLGGIKVGTRLSIDPVTGILDADAQGGAGDVTGPATNSSDYIPQWNGANSKTLKDGLAVPDGGLAGLTALGLKLDSSAFSDAGVTGKLITGFSSGAGTVEATDTILQALNKLNGNIAAKEVPLTFGSGVTRTANAVANDLITGKSGGQTILGGTGALENLILSSCSHSTIGSVNVGTIAKGENLNIQATEGAELAPALTGNSGVNWTLSNTTGYTQPFAGTIDKTGDGTGTITPTAATQIVSGVTYKVVITVSAISGSTMYYTMGGIYGTYLTAATTYTDYITAKATTNFMLTPSATGLRITITSISIKALTDVKGDLTVYGNLNVKSPSLFESIVEIKSQINASKYSSVFIGSVNQLSGGIWIGESALSTTNYVIRRGNSGTTLDLNGPGGYNVNIKNNDVTNFYSYNNALTFATSATSGQQDHSIDMARNQLTAGTGSTLTISSGGVTASSTDKNAGDLILKSGISTGTGTSAIRLFTATPASSTGSGDNTPTEKFRLLGNGNLALGAFNATGVLHLPAGTATVGTQPIKLTTGTPPTTASTDLGAIGWTDPQLYMYHTDGSVARRNFIFDNGTLLTSGRIPVIVDAYSRLGDFAGLTYSDSTGLATTKNITSSGNHIFDTVAKGLVLKQGANGKCGTFTANGVTPVTVSNTSIAISDAIIISLNTVGGTVGMQPVVATITAATGFTVVCTAGDTSIYNYSIISNAS